MMPIIRRIDIPEPLETEYRKEQRAFAEAQRDLQKYKSKARSRRARARIVAALTLPWLVLSAAQQALGG